MRSDPKLGNAWAWRPSRKRGDREDLGCGHYALPAASMDTNLEHADLDPSGRSTDDGGKVDKSTRITRLVVVPAEHLHQVTVGHGEIGVEDAGGETQGCRKRRELLPSTRAAAKK